MPGLTAAVVRPGSAAVVTSGGAVIVGGVVSFTVTCCVADAVPAELVAVQVTSVVPSGKTLPLGTPLRVTVAPALAVGVPRARSVTIAQAHVAPGPVPTVTSGGAVIVGGGCCVPPFEDETHALNGDVWKSPCDEFPMVSVPVTTSPA